MRSAEEAVEADVRALTRLEEHRLVALPEGGWEGLKIGGGTPPVRMPRAGWSCTTGPPEREPVT